MDQEYLKHIDSSPYVDEGFFDTAKASAAALGQRVKNVLPSEDPYNTPFNTKLLSYYKSFINELKDILEEFSLGPKSPAERLRKSQLSPEQSEIVNSLTNLYQTLVPSVFPAGTRPEIRGATAQGITNPQNISFTKSMQHLAREAWIGRANTRSGGEVDNIINKYVNEVKAAYSKFIKNISKFFPGVLSSKISDSFKSTIGDPKISKTIGKIENVAKSNIPAEEVPTTPSPADPPVLTSEPTRPTSGGMRGSPTDEKKNANDLATLIAATLNIISTRVIQDKNSRPYYSKPLANGNFYLPTSVDEPYPLQHSSEWNPPRPPHKPDDYESNPEAKSKYDSEYAEYEKKTASYRYVPIKNEKGEITGYTYKRVVPGTVKDVPKPTVVPPSIPEPPIQEADTPDPSASAGEGEDEEPDTGDEVELTGEFLYDLASLYRKSHKYSIEVTDSPVKVVFEDGRETVIRVFIKWDDHLNTILVQTLKDGKSWQTSELLKFYDDQVNPQSPYYSEFNVSTFLEQVNSHAKTLFEKADKEKHNEIEKTLKIFKPAAYAIVRRKGPMEFKSYKTLRFHIPMEWEGIDKNNTNYGSVKLLRGKFGKFPRGSIIPFKTIHDYYYTKKNEATQTKFEDALNEAGYWESYPEIKNEFKEPAPIIGDDDEIDSTDISKIPAAVDAIKALVVMGFKEKIATDIIKQVVDKVGPDKTKEEYTKLALSEPKKEPEEKPTTPIASKPATSTTSTDWKSVKNAIIAYNDLRKEKKFAVDDPTYTKLIQQAVDKLGIDKTPDEYKNFVKNNLPSDVASTTPETPKQTINLTPILPQPEPSAVNPEVSPKSKEEEILLLLNKRLETLGLEKLDNIEQLNRLNSIKGGYNTSISKQAQAIDNREEREKILSKQLKGAPTEENKTIWAEIIAKAKAAPAVKRIKKSSPDVTEGIINPFQLINFI
jgi:hypothetical protein